MGDLPNIEVTKERAHLIVDQLAEKWTLPVEIDCRRHTLEVPEYLGKGKIIAYNNPAGADALIFDAEFRRETTFELGGSYPDPITFYVQSAGRMTVESDHLSFPMIPLQSTIHGGFGHDKYRLRIPAEEPISSMMIFVHRAAFFAEIDCQTLHVSDELLDVIVDGDNVNKEFLFQDIFHLPVINAFRAILDQGDRGLLQHTFAIGKMYEALYYCLNQYQYFNKKPNARRLRRREKISAIQQAEQIVVGNLQDPPTIPELAKMVGLNQQSLKTGFRQLYGSSINQYLNERRLQIAGTLIRAGEMSLREIALYLGYGNHGYFSRRFKDKYGVSPRDFGNREEEE